MRSPPVPLHRVVVVGAGYAGLLAAARLARHPGLAVTLVDPATVFIERIRLHQRATGQPLHARPLADLIGSGVRWVRARATAIDLDERRVSLAGEPAVGYDQLVLAVGSVVDRERVPGVAAHCLSLQTGDDCREIAARAQRGGHAVVVGGGLTGIEAACELAEAYPGLKVTLLGQRPPGHDLSPAGAEHLQMTFDRLGVHVLAGVTVREARAGQLLLADGTRVDCDLCVWAGGFRAPDLAARAGLPVAADGRVLVDAALRVPGRPEVLVVGDAAHVRSDAGAPLRMACATAMPMGAHAAEQVVRRLEGRPPTPLRCGAVLACLSLGRREGLVQMLTPDDRPRPTILRGRVAVLLKEAICRMTVVMLRAEARGIRAYKWSQPRPGPALPAAQAGVH
jgi:NADH dehydrogenase